MPRVVHFEIVAEDPQKMSKFYGDLFGWNINQWGTEEYWLVQTGEGPGIDGGIVRSKGKPLTVNTIDVPNLEEYIEKAEKNGGKIAVPKMAIPGVGYLAYCMDPEGTVFGLMQSDKEAK